MTSFFAYISNFVERVDGTQARLKQVRAEAITQPDQCGKGGWDSGEIETQDSKILMDDNITCGKGGWDSGEIETSKIG